MKRVASHLLFPSCFLKILMTTFPFLSFSLISPREGGGAGESRSKALIVSSIWNKIFGNKFSPSSGGKWILYFLFLYYFSHKEQFFYVPCAMCIYCQWNLHKCNLVHTFMYFQIWLNQKCKEIIYNFCCNIYKIKQFWISFVIIKMRDL